MYWDMKAINFTCEESCGAGVGFLLKDELKGKPDEHYFMTRTGWVMARKGQLRATAEYPPMYGKVWKSILLELLQEEGVL